METEWTASALFSPSKARAQQAQAKDWAAIELWLARRYGPRLPTFERNEETLQALLTVANLNEIADEQRAQVERVEKTAYQALSKRERGSYNEIVQAMVAELANETHLDTLAEAFVESDCPSLDVVNMANSIIELTTTQFETAEQLRRVDSQVDALKREQVRLRQLLTELRSDSFQPPRDALESTADLQKSTKHLKAKIAEYDERLGGSRPSTADHTIENIQRRMEVVAMAHAKLANLEAQSSAYRDLPTDQRAARRQLEDAQDQLRSMMTRRDELFERLADV